MSAYFSKNLILSLGVATMLSLAIGESRAETTCTWEGTKLIIGGSGEFSGCDSVYDDDDNEIDWGEQQVKITEIEFGDGITALGNYVFDNVPNLTTLNTNNITTIGEECFDNLQSLLKVTMPKVERIENWAFENSNNLISIELPSSLVYVDSDAFRTYNDIEFIIPDNLKFVSDEYEWLWNTDALNDTDEGLVIFKCKGNSEKCKENIQKYMVDASNVSSKQVIFDAGDHKECLKSADDDLEYYHTGTECAELPESGNITCDSGYADYNGNCYAQLPFSKKRWTPAEANEWLHDGNDNFVVITFKK